MSIAARRPRLARTPGDARTTVAAAAEETSEPVAYVGLATRTIAFAIDAAIIDLVAIVVGVAAGLALSILKLPDELKAVTVAAAAVAFVLWSLSYFVVFWSTTGQTPGSRALRIRVCDASGSSAPLLPRRALLRFGALLLAVIPLFAGVLVILVDARRRGFHDWLARTVVVEHEDEAAARRRTRRNRS